MSPRCSEFLPVTPDQPFSEGNDQAWIDQHRKTEAGKFGLPETASWNDIAFAKDEYERGILAEVLRIPVDDYSVQAKDRGLTDSIYPSWRNILTTTLDLPPNARIETIAEKIHEFRQKTLEKV